MKKKALLIALIQTVAFNASADLYKVSNDGKMIAKNSPEWSCVYDSTRHLLWENKTKANVNYSYSWYNPTDSEPGYESKGKCGNPGSCDTQKYIKDVNGNQLCGYSDWRLPTTKELEYLVVCPKTKSGSWVENYKCIDYRTDGLDPQINSEYFPNTGNYSYWSSETYLELTRSAWFVNFYTGESDRNSKFDLNSVRLVRTASLDTSIIPKDISVTNGFYNADTDVLTYKDSNTVFELVNSGSWNFEMTKNLESKSLQFNNVLYNNKKYNLKLKAVKIVYVLDDVTEVK